MTQSDNKFFNSTTMCTKSIEELAKSLALSSGFQPNLSWKMCVCRYSLFPKYILMSSNNSLNIIGRLQWYFCENVCRCLGFRQKHSIKINKRTFMKTFETHNSNHSSNTNNNNNHNKTNKHFKARFHCDWTNFKYIFREH